MTTYNTGNPVGSVDVRDLYDNSENLDNFANGPLDAYTDRLGVSRQSLQGIRNASQYQVLGPYAAGLVFTSYNQVFSYLGEFYAPGPSIALPYTTSGAGAGEIANFRPVGDTILRSDMANSADPAKGAALVGFSSETVYSALTRALASNTLDTTRIEVPSAATVNLTASAPNTRHINITGTTGITSFTVAAGRCYFVRFAGIMTLTNNASIVTQSGANITTATGDTCIVRAIAENVVEVLAYTPVTALLDTTRIEVPSAATVNLTNSAPNTRHINITGTTTITAFTVAAGQTYFVRFAGALTLTNNAGIVTQRGANIVTQAGDTCIIRATAANVVEVMVYVDATVQSLAANGYRKFKDGMIIQWGKNTVPADSSLNVTLPVAFSVSGFSATTAFAQAGDYNDSCGAFFSFTSILVLTNGSNTTRAVHWMAIGQ